VPQKQESTLLHLNFVRAAAHVCRAAGMLALLAMLNACDKPKVDELPADVTLTGLNGTQISLQTFHGRLLVLNVWASWCPPCRREMPSLERLSKKADSKHIAVAGIATDQSVNAVREFISQHGISFEIFSDTPMNVANILGVHIYPETLLVSPDGKLIQRISGEREWDSPAMLKALEEAYKGKRSAADFTQAATSYGTDGK
jgi:thiol-disulfide isomerase/thioredoxin